MKIYHWLFFGGTILWLVWQNFKYEIKTELIDRHLDDETSTVVGELIGHDRVNLGRGRSRKISIVEFYANGDSFIAEMDRLKVPTSIRLEVIYKTNNPKWHRVIVPDSLEMFHMPNGFVGEEIFYTWPPTKPDDRRIMKKDKFKKGPY